MSGQPPTVRIAVEGEGDIAMAEALVRHCGGDPTPPKAYVGKPKLDPVIPRLNQAGRNTPWLVLRDCDLDDRPHNGCRDGSSPN